MTVLTLPKPKLSDVTAITIATPDLEQSLKFYEQLGFKELMRMDLPFPWIQISDGALLIMLRKDNTPYLALTYYVKEMDRVVSELEAEGVKFAEKKDFGFIRRNLIISPDNLNISLVTYAEGFEQPAGPTMLTMPQSDYFNPEKYVNKACGMFGELAHPVSDLSVSIPFWEKLGFAVLSKFESPYPWAILSDGLAVVGLHQTKQFSNPAITFFASDMKDKIEKLKNSGLKNLKSIDSRNIALITPEKQYVNLFQLGM
jgi:predicted lactoylglutathione lyase